MDPISTIPIVVNFALAYFATYFISKIYVIELPAGRVATIDGLRGYLGFSVFLHHSSIWYFYINTAKWQIPPSNIYTHLGETAVAFFFMVTGFLFFSKLIESKEKNLSWTHLYISRIFRLVPLYFFTMILMMLIVAILSDWQMNEPFGKLIYDAAHWLAFLGGTDLNGLPQTWIITAGVTWTLKYEWVFYMTLPLMALLVPFVPPIGYLFVAMLSLASIKWLNLNGLPMLAFLSGIIVSCLVRYEVIRSIVSSKYSSFLAISCLLWVVEMNSSADNIASLFFTSLVFLIIAGGNSMFGVLTNRTSRIMGEFTYGIYLLHGVFLYSFFKFGLGFSHAQKLTALEYWATITFGTPILILIAFFANRYIERPSMRAVPCAFAWIQKQPILIGNLFLTFKNKFI